MNVIVIGGGASGLMAAITAAKSAYDALSDEDKALVEHARQLKAEGKEACSLLYKPDLLWNPVRYACVLEQLRRQFKKFKKYYPVQK